MSVGAPLQVSAQADGFVTPSVSLSGIYDSNLFLSQTDREEDYYLRLSPAIAAAHRSERLFLQGSYVQDAEAYASHRDLDTSRARQYAAAELRYEPTPVAALAANASYTQTLRPGELSPQTGLEFGRKRGERALVAPSLDYRFDAVTTGTGGYTYTRDRIEGGVDTDTHTATLGWERRLAPRDKATLGYVFNRFVFGDQQTTDAHIITIGGSHEFTQRTSATLSAGPRFSEGTTRPEISAVLRHRLQQGEVSLSYIRTQVTAIGLAGPVDVQSGVAAAALTPARAFELRGSTSASHSTRGGFEARAYRLNLEARRRLGAEVSLVASYDYTLQQGSLDTPDAASMVRHVVLLGIAWSPRAEERAR